MINLQNPDTASTLVISSILEGVDFSNVEVRTLKSHYIEILQEQALNRHSGILNSIQPNYEKLDRRIQEYLNNPPDMQLRQFVDFTQGDGRVIVYLDSDVVDDSSWNAVISTLSQVEQMTGLVEFGAPINFGSKKQHPKITNKSRNYI